MSNPVIIARGLRKAYGEFVAVAGVDFEIERGECFGFLGPNGAGKTTTMRMIYRASPVGGGELEIMGLNAVTDAHDRVIKRKLGVVPQQDNLDEELTVRENLAVFTRFYGLRRAEAHKRIEELLEFSELGFKADAKVIELSGGMRRRLLVARGLIGDPEIVVLDEPTTGLDPRAREKLWEKLAALKEQKATLLLTTHYMREAERLCDRLVIMDKGVIVGAGTPQSLIEEHVPPYVVEIRRQREEGVLEDLAPEVFSAAERHELLRDRVMLYTHDGEGLIARVAAALPDHQTLLRRASLEDVFLRITGRGLDG